MSTNIIIKLVGKCERSGTREFTLENTLGHKTMFFGVKMAVRGRRWTVCVSAVSRLDPVKWPTKCAGDCSENAVYHQNRLKNDGFGPLLAIHSFQFIHFKIISIHSFQVIHFKIHFNSFISSHSFQVLHVNLFISLHSISSPLFQFFPFNSFVAFIQFNLFLSIRSIQVIHFNSFISSPLFQSVHVTSFMLIPSCHLFHFSM